MPIHPLSSQLLRFFVIPSMAYFESLLMVSGLFVQLDLIAISMAYISPAWLDWVLPETLRLRFFGVVFPIPYSTAHFSVVFSVV